MDKVFIKDLLIRGVIGVTEHERSSPQDIVVNITLFTDTQPAGHSDHLADTTNYSTVAKKVFTFVEKAQRYTVEALAEDIAGLLLEEPRVEGVCVRVEKPGAVRFSRSVGVEIERFRGQPPAR